MATIANYLHFLVLKPFALVINWYYNPPVPLTLKYFDDQIQASNNLHSGDSNARVRIRALKNSNAERTVVQQIVCDGLMAVIVGNFTPFRWLGVRMSCILCAAAVGGGMVLSVMIRKLVQGIVPVEWMSNPAIENVFVYALGLFTAYFVIFTLFPYWIIFNYLLKALETDMRDPYDHYCNAGKGRNFFVAVKYLESEPSKEVIVGTIAVQEPEEASPFNPETDIEIRRVSIVPDARGQGIARMLRKEVEQFALASKHLKRMVLSTSSLQPKAIMMYKRYMFRELIRIPVRAVEIVFMMKDIPRD